MPMESLILPTSYFIRTELLRPTVLHNVRSSCVRPASYVLALYGRLISDPLRTLRSYTGGASPLHLTPNPNRRARAFQLPRGPLPGPAAVTPASPIQRAGPSSPRSTCEGWGCPGHGKRCARMQRATEISQSAVPLSSS